MRYTLPELAPAEFLARLPKHIPGLIAQLLYSRGLSNESEIEEFLNPSFETGLHSPFLFRNMEAAVALPGAVV